MFTACTHDELNEPGILQAMLDQHIHWIGDFHITPRRGRVHNWPIFKQLLNSIGVLEVNRKNPNNKLLFKLLNKTVHIFEKGGIVGTFPLGSTWEDRNLWNVNTTGPLLIIANTQKKLHFNIPIIPIGIRKEKERYKINIGEPIYVNNKDPNKMEEQGKKLIQIIYQLRNG